MHVKTRAPLGYYIHHIRLFEGGLASSGGDLVGLAAEHVAHVLRVEQPALITGSPISYGFPMIGGRGSSRDLVTGYRPWMDGVRGVGILAVVAQHTLGSAMPVDIGYYGLAMFFALSGYLITSLLLDERIATGAVSLRAFYMRRAGRLVPALVLAVIVMDVLFVIAGDYVPLPGSVAALTYTANYWEIVDGDSVGGFGPTWSLAVEEHFYLLWPLALLFMMRRWGLHVALWATLAICVGAMVWRGVLAVLGAPEAWLAIGSLERADALLYG
ncbi:MAG: acyltransferase, partial [Chloroflexi bacterium]|nr:acyltransferase [Chloroflexota bacterium]